MITLHAIRKSFGKNAILHGIDLEVKAGEIVGLLGPSGCGKTTLIDIVVGNTLPDDGSALLGGEMAPYKHMRERLGFMPQETALYEDITARDNLRFFGALYHLSPAVLKQRADAALKLAWLEDQGKKLVVQFSGGMKRRLSLAVALLPNPQVLVMDEPTVGLDPIHRGHLWQSFRSMADAGAAILITTHVMDEAARCDKVALMREGQLIAFDAPANIMRSTKSEDLETAFIKIAQGIEQKVKGAEVARVFAGSSESSGDRQNAASEKVHVEPLPTEEQREVDEDA